MSFLGKLLVGFQLALSIIFLGFAGAVFTAQQNWKLQKETADKNFASLTAEKDQLVEEARQFKERVGPISPESQKLVPVVKNLEDALAAANGKAAGLETSLNAAEKELGAAKTERDEARTLAKLATEEARQRRDEALAQRAVNNDLHKLLNLKNDKVKAQEDIIFNKQVEEKSLNEKHSKLLSELAILQKILAANGLPNDPKSVAGLQTPPPAVDGQVLETKRGGRGGADLVEISLGTDDGLAEGHKLSVFRPAVNDRAAKFLGEIKIVFVTPDRAVGTVVSRAKNGIIEKGDGVTSKL